MNLKKIGNSKIAWKIPKLINLFRRASVTIGAYSRIKRAQRPTFTVNQPPRGGWGVYLKHPGIRRFWGDYQGISNKTGTRFPAAAGGPQSRNRTQPDQKHSGISNLLMFMLCFTGQNNSNSVGTSITDSSAYSHDCVPAYSRM